VQPNLGTPAPAYDQGFFGTSFGGLNAYFSKLTAIFSALFGQRGGKWINNPYGAFSKQTVFISFVSMSRINLYI